MKPYLFFLIVISMSCQAQKAGKYRPKETFPKASYPELISLMTQTRDSLQALYLKGDELQRKKITDYSREFLFATITNDFFNEWYGTAWDFNGTTKTPKQGKIACGYFVTTVLLDAGFNIPRIKWAQSASEVFIQKVSRDIKRFSNQPVSDVIDYLKNNEDGLYIVGLDQHTGFIYKNKNILKFVHSSYYEPEIGVMAQNLDSENPLRDSKYRVIGRILDDELIISWILNEAME